MRRERLHLCFKINFLRAPLPKPLYPQASWQPICQRITHCAKHYIYLSTYLLTYHPSVSPPIYLSTSGDICVRHPSIYLDLGLHTSSPSFQLCLSYFISTSQGNFSLWKNKRLRRSIDSGII